MDSERCNVPESECEAVLDSDGYDTILESEYGEFTDSKEQTLPESRHHGFEDDDDELGCDKW